jgi:hypothetical protein
LKQQFAEAIEDKVCRSSKEPDGEAPPWMKLYGAFAKSEEMRHETRRIQKLIGGEFEILPSPLAEFRRWGRA